MMGGIASQDQPHARALSDLRRNHRTDALADFRRLAPRAARSGCRVPQRCNSAAGLCDSGGALRVVAISISKSA